MKTNEIRSRFLKFFSAKNHKIIRSDSLVPKDDPTVLFTTAGMQQFKKQFLGQLEGFTRASTSQKCLRTDDLDEVGKTDFHHTFFEMLGNFSFGDYFKKDAISWAWEFLTVELNIPEDKLWVSVYKEDSEAENIWKNEIKIPAARIVKLGDKSNFWPSNAKENGPNGPCGPCSEIFYDYGPNPRCTKNACDPSCDCGRFSEVWNLVFTQFNRKDGGVLDPLPSKNIDTGMGLERLSAVMQGKKSNFDTDIFEPIMKAIEEAQVKIPLDTREKRIIADHIRAVVFGINDGVVPSNEGRGYVIKKLIINSSDILLQKGTDKPSFFKLAESVVTAMHEPYPEIKNNSRNIADMIKGIEEAYIKVYKERIPELATLAQGINDPDKLGEAMFRFKDTYGLTIGTIEKTILPLYEKNGKTSIFLETAYKKFEQLLQSQQKQSRSSSKMTGDVFINKNLDLNVPKTEFLGYKHPLVSATVLRIFINDCVRNSAQKGDSIKIILDKSPFYAESGGQVGDTGKLTNDHCSVKIISTEKQGDVFIHIGEVEEGELRTNDPVTAEIDYERRLSIMRNHTATHILQSALREILGQHVKQQGSWVGEDRLRFDFTHPKALCFEELSAIEEKVNGYILSCDSVTKEFLTLDEAKETGALAFFAEKYGETVRVVSIGNYSKELCGGTHLENVGQIGLFKITSESAIAQGIRRIEATTGHGALAFIAGQQKSLLDIANTLKAPIGEVTSRAKAMAEKIKSMEKELDAARFDSIKASIDDILQKAENHAGTKIISRIFKDIEIGILRKVCDLIRQKENSSAIILGAKSDGNASLIISFSEDLVKIGLRADECIKKVAPLINGSGGGKPQLAQAGSKDPGNIDEAVKQAISTIKQNI
ncbi:MAG: alanine--tRNA ligase [Candidatus Omnitrophica bacterium]|nr:alanine--tRNA ligase [Candidatus Omnitrophota bacterium]